MTQLLHSRSIKNFFAFFSDPILLAFAATILYWIYLFFTTTILIRFDAIGYQSLGTLIHEQGWIPFFKEGPHREPVYSFIISISMNLGKLFSIPYQLIQKFIQLLFLFSTQILALKILRNLKVRDTMVGLCILYLGFSPSLVNSACSLFSEIVTYPFILGIVLLSARLWRTFSTDKPPLLILKSLLFVILFFALTLTKGIYEYIFYLFLIPFFLVCIQSFSLKKKNKLINILIFLTIAISFFGLLIHSYKHLNKKYNGRYTIADNRGPYSICSSATRRTGDLTFKQVLTRIAYTGGQGACESIFSKEDCSFWGIHNYDVYGMTVLTIVNGEYPKDKVSGIMINFAKERILQKPFQFIFFTVLESMKMFFWESTQIGFVKYAPWQTKLYAFGPFKNALRLFMSLLSLSAFLFALIFAFKNRKQLLGISSPENKSIQMLGFMLLISICHIGMYSLFMTIPRFIFPIVPLYLIIIAFSLDRIIPHNKRS